MGSVASGERQLEFERSELEVGSAAAGVGMVEVAVTVSLSTSLSLSGEIDPRPSERGLLGRLPCSLPLPDTGRLIPSAWLYTQSR